MAISSAHRPLIQILHEARALLDRPANDFDWSSWQDAAAATAELDQHIELIERGRLPARLDLSVIFAPTGSMQEVSISSGWGGEFLALAERFDAAAAALKWT
jgi:hypothetical protein